MTASGCTSINPLRQCLGFAKSYPKRVGPTSGGELLRSAAEGRQLLPRGEVLEANSRWPRSAHGRACSATLRQQHLRLLQVLHVFRRQPRLRQLDDELVQLPGERERHLLVVVLDD